MSCPGDKIITDYVNGVVICAETGEVLDVVYDYSEPRRFSNREVNTGVSPINPVLHDYGFHTDISSPSFSNGSDDEAILSYLRAKRLKYINNFIRYSDGKSRKHINIVGTARDILSKLNSTSLLPEVAMLARKLEHRTVCKNTYVLATALVYLACRLRGVPRTIQDIAEVTGLRWDEIGRCYRTVVEILNIKPPSHTPISFIPKIAGTLKLHGNVTSLATELIKKVQERCGGFQGNDPLGVAAGAIYIASLLNNTPIPQYVISNSIDVSEATIRARYREIAKCLEKEGMDVSSIKPRRKRKSKK